MKTLLFFLTVAIAGCSFCSGSALAATKTCSTLAAFNGTANDASATIQNCIDSGAANDIIELPAGKYFVAHQIKISNNPITLRTQGKNNTMPRCSNNVNDCAELVATATFDGYNGIINVSQSGTNIDHIVVNGNKGARVNSPSTPKCLSGATNGWGFNIKVIADNFNFTNNISKNALCGSGFGMDGNNNKVLGNLIASSGTHNVLVCDGMTLGSGNGSVIENNTIFDSSDIDLVLGACPNCSVRNNTIRHDNYWAGASFSGLQIQSWPNGGSSGNYTGAVFSGNTIDCGADKRCGFGLNLGGHAWYMSMSYGGSIHDNTITNAQQGLVIDDYHDAQVYNNPVSNVSGYKYTIGTQSYNIDKSSDTLGAVYQPVNWDGKQPNTICTNDCNLPANNAKFISQSVPSSMTVGQTYQVSITMQNNGGNEWNEIGSYHLGSQNPQDNGTWGTGRILLTNGETVDLIDQNTKTFTFNVTAPRTAGTYNFQWQMVQEVVGGGWFGDKTANVAVTVTSGSCTNPCTSGAKQCGTNGGVQTCTLSNGCTAWSAEVACPGGKTCRDGACLTNTGTNGAQFVTQSVSSSMTAGQTYSVSITMKNTGTTSWTAAGAYKLGSQNPQDNGTWTGNNRVLLSAGESIAPGQSKTFTFNVTAPSINGTYNFQWKMVQEWVQWFGDSTPNIAVAVTSASCTDDCTPSGAKQCSGTTGYQTCGNYDTDTCLEWSSAMACAAGQTCSGGTCGSSAANYSIPIAVGNTGSVLSDYQVKITVPYNSHMKPSFDDIRFTASDGTNLSYWRESYTASAAIFWVKINSIPAGSSTIYLKYGDASASTASNGADTFVLYDDFNSGSVSDWTLSSSCGTGARVANSSVYHSSPYSLQNYFTGRCGAGYSYSSRSFTAPVNGTYAVDFYAKSMGCSGCTVSARLFFDNSQLFTQSISGALQAGTVASSLTAGTHTVKVGMYTTNAFSGTFQAYFDDIHVRKTASPAPTYSLGSEQLAMDDGAELSQVAGANTVSYAELQAKISQIQQSILLLIEQMRVMLSTRL